jgi:hypothetical protein
MTTRAVCVPASVVTENDCEKLCWKLVVGRTVTPSIEAVTVLLWELLVLKELRLMLRVVQEKLTERL